jgi:putative flippase GtrA
VVGVASNLLLYAAFLALLQFGWSPLAAMTATYAGALAFTFTLNRRWTFGDSSRVRRTLPRFLTAQAAGYALNFALLRGLVDGLGWPAAGVQGFAILLVAALLFVAQKYWIFRAPIQG